MRIAVAVGLEDLRPGAVNIDLGHRAHHRVGVGRSVIEYGRVGVGHRSGRGADEHHGR
jgi:hypothetical protein